ncbi:MAG: helix-turn-helix transcriptional regulator, partial [Hungatella sp.]
YIRQLFKAKTELGFMEYLIKRRMEEAEKLLKSSSLKIQEVAMKVGYSDQKYFARCFKKHCGYSPTEYRDQRRS